jgi:hypothetical protein
VAKSWKDENFETMSDAKLRDYLENSQRLIGKNEKLQESKELEKMCVDEITKRDLKSDREPLGTRSTDPVRKMEIQVAQQLAGVYKQAYETYDLRNNMHEHMAKVGGGHQQKRCAIDRYISYKVGKDVISLNADLAKRHTVDQLAFIVFAPKHLLPGGKTGEELRPHFPEAHDSQTVAWGQKFSSCTEAAELFISLVGKLAKPKLK